MKRKEIVLTKETRQKEYVRKVMDAISPYLTLKPSDKIAIKINLCGSREIYANTHYETVESLIFYFKDQFGITDISVIEGSDGAYYSGKSTWDIFYKFKYKEVELNGAKLVNLDDLPHDKQLDVTTLSGDRQVSYTAFETDYMISVVPPKTHNIFPVTISIPNMVGFVKAEDRAFMYGASHTELKKINSFKNARFLQLLDLGGKNFARLLKAINPSMALIDGLYGMEGKGPVKGSPVFHGFAVASDDNVLADALTTYVMGFDVDDIYYLKHAFQEGLGNTRWQKVIGVDPCQVKFPYRPHPIFQKQKVVREQFSQGVRKDRPESGDNNRDNRKDFRRRDGRPDNHQEGRKPFPPSFQKRAPKKWQKNEGNTE